MSDNEKEVKAEDLTPEKAEKAKAAEEDSDSDDDLFGDDSTPKGDEDKDESPPVEKEDTAPTNNGNDAATPAVNGTEDNAPRPADPRLSVPRKAPATPAASGPRSPSSVSSLVAANVSNDTGTSSRPGYPGPSVGLPEEISVPVRVDSKLLQGRLMDTLRQLPNDLITDALNEYDDALQNKGASIRNQGAYLYGVIKRYVNVQERAASGSGNVVMGRELTPIVTERLDKLVQDGFCTQEEMNDKVKSKIRMLSEKDALFAIDELSSVDRGSIRNFSSYFMGILNRYMRGDTSTGGPARPRRDERRDRYDNYPPTDRHDRFRGRSPDRDRDSYRRRDDDRYGDHRGDSRYRRDRSRDRYDDDRGRGDYGRHESSRSSSYRDRPRYDDRDRNHSHYGNSQYGAPPPPPPRQQNNMPPMNAYAPQPQQQPPQQQQMYMPPNQQQPQVFQQQAPQQFVPQQQQGGVPGSSFVPQQQNMISQQTPQMRQPQTFVPNMQPQQQQQFSAPAPAASFQSTSTTTTIPADILGLANKAASAVQALQASRSLPPVVNMSAPPQQMMQMQPMMQGQPMQGQPFSSYSSQPPPVRRGRTTATMSELPVMVQYAVQNLQATGHVDGILDDGMLGMIKELPEPLALGALQRFASIDTSSMRNKTAYLAGVLRRELEKNNQR